MKKSLSIKQIIAIVAFSILLVVLVVGDVLCYVHAGEIGMHLAPAKENINKDTSEETLAKGDELVQTIESEGATLLKNDGTLPLAVKENEKYKVNLFGVGSTDAQKYGFFYTGVGAGAASINGKYKTTLQKGLEEAGFEVNTALMEAYKTQSEKKGTTFDEAWYNSNPEVLQNAKTFSDTAIITIARTTGENCGFEEGTYDTNSYRGVYLDNDADGRNLIQLSVKEEAMIKWVGENFEKVIVLINSGNTMELGALDNENVNSVLYVGLPGQSGTKAIGKILAGKINPSGKTADTFAYDTKANPTYANTVPTTANGRQIAYAEDIYVGYKWYETAHAEGYFEKKGTSYDKVVQYPFGYGLSYTTFEWTVDSVKWLVGKGKTEYVPKTNDTFTDKNTTIEITVSVKNTGKVAGKEVVQCYYSAPYTKGGIEKSAVNLVAFEKTELIEPNESKKVTLSFDIYDMASYDCYDKNENGFKGWELDPGEYHIKLMKNSHEVADCASSDIVYNVPVSSGNAKKGITYRLDPTYAAGIVVNRFTGENAEAGVPIDGSKDASNKIIYLSRADFEGTFPTTQVTPRKTGANNGYYYKGFDEKLAAGTLNVPTLNNTENNLYLFTLEDGSKATKEDLLRQSGRSIKANEELIMELGGNYNSEKWGQLLSQLTIEEIDLICTSAGFGTDEAVSVGKPYLKDFDGSCGFGMNGFNVGGAIETSYWTGFPTLSVLAMTWNKDLAYEMGAVLGGEAYSSGGINGIYGPTINLHRSPYHTRNFEAMSEDGVLSGYLGASYVHGANTHGLMTYLKHLVLSELGQNPSNVNTWLTEQNLRETYLRAFEIAIKKGKTTALMSAFNNIGGTKCAYSNALLNGVIRNEWGFRGAIITDYNVGETKYLIRSGNDIKLSPNNQTVGLSASNGADVYAGVRAIKNVLYSYCNMYYQTKKFDPTKTIEMVELIPSFQWWIPALVGVNVLVVGSIGLGVYLLFFKKEKALTIG